LEWSYASCPGDVPLLGVTIGNLLQQRAEQHPDKEAFVVYNGDSVIRRTFAQLLEEVG
jgi:hypothetical protein